MSVSVRKQRPKSKKSYYVQESFDIEAVANRGRRWVSVEGGSWNNQDMNITGYSFTIRKGKKEYYASVALDATYGIWVLFRCSEEWPNGKSNLEDALHSYLRTNTTVTLIVGGDEKAVLDIFSPAIQHEHIPITDVLIVDEQIYWEGADYYKRKLKYALGYDVEEIRHKVISPPEYAKLNP